MGEPGIQYHAAPATQLLHTPPQPAHHLCWSAAPPLCLSPAHGLNALRLCLLLLWILSAATDALYLVSVCTASVPAFVLDFVAAAHALYLASRCIGSVLAC